MPSVRVAEIGDPEADDPDRDRSTTATFDVAFASRTVTGRGCASRTAEELRRAGAQRVGVVVNRSLRASPMFERLLSTLGSDAVVFSDVRPHTPRATVLQALRIFRRRGCDAIVSIGGGSAIDTAKGVVLGLAGDVDDVAGFDAYVSGPFTDGLEADFSLPRETILHVSVPTTLSGAAHSHSVGISDERSGEKRLHVHPALGPRCVLLDPLVTRETPPGLWAATGMKALEHVVEGLYSRGLPPFAAPMRLHALGILARDLGRSLDSASEDGLAARGHVLVAGGLAVLGWPSVAVGLSHALGHQAGAAWHIEHGFSTTIFLPHVLEFNASAAGAALEQMAAAVGGASGNPLDVVLSQLEEMRMSLGLPRRLRDVGVEATAEFGRVARAAVADPIMGGNPRAVTVADVEAILRAAY